MDNYRKSLLLMRTAIGAVGILLPLTLILIDRVALKGGILARGSLSAYYHSGARDVFVGTLFAIAIFLITYKVFEHHWDNRVSTVAGIAALGVALFPTARPADSDLPLTGLQERLGESLVRGLHFTFTLTFILSIAAICILFGRQATGPWKRFHWGCVVVIAIAIVFVIGTNAVGRFDDYSMLLGEWAAVWAFGASWLVKGALSMPPVQAAVAKLGVAPA